MFFLSTPSRVLLLKLETSIGLMGLLACMQTLSLPLLAVYGPLSYFVFFLSGKKERPFQKTQSTKEIKAPPSPTLHLPDPVSSADLKAQDEEDQEFGRSSVIRRSFGLRGSKKGSKEKRVSSVF